MATNAAARGYSASFLDQLTTAGGELIAGDVTALARDAKVAGLNILNTNKATIGFSADITDVATAGTARTELEANKVQAAAVDVLNTNKATIGFTANIIDVTTAGDARVELEAKNDKVAAVGVLNTNKATIGFTTDIINVATAGAARVELEAKNDKVDAVGVLNTNKATIGFTTDITNVATAGAARTELEDNKVKADAYETIDTANTANFKAATTVAQHAAAVNEALAQLIVICQGDGTPTQTELTAGVYTACKAACDGADGFHFATGWTIDGSDLCTLPV
ncbi:hypothetical protein NF27_JF00210 [Candidatus Jidaibacter acanthamoeba]|uniref:Uncharacterized protein n=1 Tax=Candidatus Jidaibacter acanthamoebae TaxID=86105 RepID=A0A0C1QIV9_9RICK|nr:hypothetical protein [Candidatus Jidaibacter acanthamoeba]KIE04143.1 hypothetical protein NF27_JF00210 [Candidatus Jidaibacter acanthamoeba]